MLQSLLIILGLRDDPVIGSIQNTRAIIRHSMDRTIIAEVAAQRNADATELLNETLKRATQR